MNMIALVWLIIGIVIGGFMFQTEISEAIYSIPPTQAWRTIGVSNEAVFPDDPQPTVNATNYRDILYFVSDGSILINITEFTP